jgi:hypothetical protein
MLWSLIYCSSHCGFDCTTWTAIQDWSLGWLFWGRLCQDFAVIADMASGLYYVWDPKHEIKQSPFFVRIVLHMALNSAQKAVEGSIFYCYQIHLIIAVLKVQKSVVILKSAVSICLSEANLLVLISAFRELQYCCMIKPAVNQIVTCYDSAVGFELSEIEVWTIHIHCKKWKTVFSRKLPLLQDELFCMWRNIFRRCEAYLEAGGQHFNSSVK